jgi:hypothetical protein
MRKRLLACALIVAAGAVALVAAFAGDAGPRAAGAASHREAPLISMDPTADITDFFMFRSYEAGQEDKVVLVMNVIPAQEPSAGPNYYNFDPSVRYSFNIDNNLDGRAEDIRIEFQFRNEIRGVVDALGLPLSYVGGLPPQGGPVIPPITNLGKPGDDPGGNAGLGLRQKYSVTLRQGQSATGRTVLSDDLIAVPSNVGPRTMPNYRNLAAQGIYNLGNGIRVFAGQRQDPFYIDLGAAFDSLNLRAIPPVVNDAMGNVNQFGVDMLSNFGVNTIAVELPASLLTADSGGAGAGTGATSQPLLGAYASTERPKVSVRGGAVFGSNDKRVDAGAGRDAGPFVQVQRLANPLVNELIIGTKDKDRWNALSPDQEQLFLGYYLKPRVAAALQLAFGLPTGCALPVPGCQPSPPAGAVLSPPLENFNRTDLVAVLLQYPGATPGLYADLLRLDLRTPVTRPVSAQNRLPAVLGGDTAAWPNGRRPRDDVTDVAVRVVGGPRYIEARAGDGVNIDDAPLPDAFPFLATPADGRDYMINGQQTPHLNPPPRR